MVVVMVVMMLACRLIDWSSALDQLASQETLTRRRMPEQQADHIMQLGYPAQQHKVGQEECLCAWGPTPAC